MAGSEPSVRTAAIKTPVFFGGNQSDILCPKLQNCGLRELHSPKDGRKRVLKKSGRLIPLRHAECCEENHRSDEDETRASRHQAYSLHRFRFWNWPALPNLLLTVDSSTTPVLAQSAAGVFRRTPHTDCLRAHCEPHSGRRHTDDGHTEDRFPNPEDSHVRICSIRPAPSRLDSYHFPD